MRVKTQPRDAALARTLKRHRIKLDEKNELLAKHSALAVENKQLAVQIKEEKLAEQKRILEFAKSHREVLEAEMREALLAAQSLRHTASYRDLIDATDKMKKLINTIDGVANDVERVIIIPSSLAGRFKKPVEGEVVQDPHADRGKEG